MPGKSARKTSLIARSPRLSLACIDLGGSTAQLAANES